MSTQNDYSLKRWAGHTLSVLYMTVTIDTCCQSFSFNSTACLIKKLTECQVLSVYEIKTQGGKTTRTKDTKGSNCLGCVK
ncbi:hypothetical protein QQF64_022992 [Cirrhinus molitorella]|uniref:Uncharacterized protein n=1 Tax=Cirrhinus molitorella TaxID=172907 RepID=A0ABR3L6F0_9TELE